MACPLRWDGVVIGAMNVFFAEPRGADGDEQRMVQAFAGITTIATIHAVLPAAGSLAGITHRAPAARVVIEWVFRTLKMSMVGSLTMSLRKPAFRARERAVVLTVPPGCSR